MWFYTEARVRYLIYSQTAHKFESLGYSEWKTGRKHCKWFLTKPEITPWRLLRNRIKAWNDIFVLLLRTVYLVTCWKAKKKPRREVDEAVYDTIVVTLADICDLNRMLLCKANASTKYHVSEPTELGNHHDFQYAYRVDDELCHVPNALKTFC